MIQSEPETGMPRFDPHAFPRGVVAGEITANRAITVACQRWMADLERDDIYFDHDDWLGYEAMLDDLVINDGHQLSGTKFELLPWQAWVFGAAFWRRKECGNRRYKQIALEVARGAGKTTSAATLLLYFASTIERSSTVILANTVQQAQVAYQSARAFAVDAWGDHNDPDTGDEAGWETTKLELRCRASKGRIETKAARATTLDGLKGVVYLVDESSEQTSDWLSKITSGLGKNVHALMLSVTTPGGIAAGRDSPYYTKRRSWEMSLEEEHWDMEVFAAFFGLDEEDDMIDGGPDVWIKANPSLGHTIPVESYHRQLATYQAEGDMETWERMACCRFSTKGIKWVGGDVWQENTGHPPEYPAAGVAVYAAIDFSKSFDITSLCWGWWHESRFCMRWHHWVIRQEPGSRKRDYQRHLNAWEKYPHVTVCDNSVQYELVREKLWELKQRTNLKRIGYDAMGGMKVNMEGWGDLEDGYNAETDLPMSRYPQTMVALGPATYLFEGFAKDRKFCLQDCSVAQYALANVVLEGNVNGAYRPSKSPHKTRGVIDPIVAAVMVCGVLIQEGAERPGAYADPDSIAF
jgi:phage terminase large subunit-like protein